MCLLDSAKISINLLIIKSARHFVAASIAYRLFLLRSRAASKNELVVMIP